MSIYPSKADREQPAANLSPETHKINSCTAAWARSKWPGARIIRELALGDCRVDLAVVTDRDLIAIETKARRDRPDDVKRQLKEYRRFAPEVWLVIDERWTSHEQVRSVSNLAVFNGSIIFAKSSYREAKPERSQMCATRMLEIAWREELVRIGQANNAVERPAHKSWTVPRLQDHLAMLLTGNEIIRGVCGELRRRPLHMVGIGSDAPCPA